MDVCLQVVNVCPQLVDREFAAAKKKNRLHGRTFSAAGEGKFLRGFFAKMRKKRILVAEKTINHEQMAIYTRTGDDGQTSLVGGQRVSKACDRLEAYGTIDELNSHIGLLICHCTQAADRDFLQWVQRRLFVVGGNLATDNEAGDVPESLIVAADSVERVEKEIDRLQASLSPMRAFILPGGGVASAQAHVCRTVCRRAERCILRLQEAGGRVDATLLRLVNRLSDYLFVLARHLNHTDGHTDVEW